jgi:CHAT domain-containing protein
VTHLILWNIVIDKSTKVSELADPPRVWWCPTGPLSFLPIHAAGLYNQLQDSVDVSSFVCSSYTPSLTALLNGLVAQNTSHTYKGILAISQRNAPRKSVLHNAEIEVEQVLKHAQNHGGQAALHLTGPAASVEQVLSNIEKFSWIHFACHAEQATGTPTDSAFCLHNGQLKLSKIISMSNKDAEFAFLSACQTATGDKKLSNEAVHLAAGMQFAGYRSVIATMWSIRDNDAPIVADRVYSHIFRGAEPNSTEAAHALHHAVKELRKQVGDLEFMSWVPFIHIGI